MFRIAQEDHVTTVLRAVQTMLEAIRSIPGFMPTDEETVARLDKLDDALCDLGADYCTYADSEGIYTEEELEAFLPRI